MSNPSILVPPTCFRLRPATVEAVLGERISPTALQATWRQVYEQYGQRPIVDEDVVHSGEELIAIAIFLNKPLIEVYWGHDFNRDRAGDMIAEIFKNARNATVEFEDSEGCHRLGTIDRLSTEPLGLRDIKSSSSGSRKRRSRKR